MWWSLSQKYKTSVWHQCHGQKHVSAFEESHISNILPQVDRLIENELTLLHELTGCRAEHSSMFLNEEGSDF